MKFHQFRAKLKCKKEKMKASESENGGKSKR